MLFRAIEGAVVSGRVVESREQKLAMSVVMLVENQLRP